MCGIAIGSEIFLIYFLESKLKVLIKNLKNYPTILI
jgi:hypothetical protein